MNKLNRGLITLLLAAAATCLAFAATAGEETHSVNVFKVDDGSGDPITLRFVNDEQLLNLEDGENYTTTTDDGDTISVTRNGDVLNIVTSSGRNVEVPWMHAAGDMGDGHKWVSHDATKKIKIVHASDETPHILIISPGGLTEAEENTIRQAIESAGIDKDLKFIGGHGEGHAEVDIEVEVTE